MAGLDDLKHGDQMRLAQLAGMSSASFLNDILAGRKKCPGELALKLSDASVSVLGERVPAETFIRRGLGHANA